MSLNNIVIIIYSLLTGVRVNLVGQLSGAELFALLTSPFSSYRKLIKKFPVIVPVFWCYALLLFSLILSDITNATPQVDFLRGWASIVFSFISLLFLTNNFDGSEKNIVLFLIFYSLSIVLFGESVELQSLEDDNYFKAKIVGFLNPIVIVIAYYFMKRRRTSTAIAILLLYGFINIILDGRSNSLAFFFTALLLLIKIRKVRLKRRNIIISALVILTLSYGMYCFYVSKVLSGEVGGANAKQLFLSKNPYNPFELIYYGRSETFLAMEAIADKPLQGHGSWARDRGGKYAKLNYILFDVKPERGESIIPSHSIIFTAWLWGGILGFIAICWLFVHLTRMYFLIFKHESNLAILLIITILFIGTFWDFLFSPFGHLRITVPQIAALLIIYHSRNESKVGLPPAKVKSKKYRL